MPKVSFILPAYKRRFLKGAIASILAQTYRDFEIVAVDDGSTGDGDVDCAAALAVVVIPRDTMRHTDMNRLLGI